MMAARVRAHADGGAAGALGSGEQGGAVDVDALGADRLEPLDGALIAVGSQF